MVLFHDQNCTYQFDSIGQTWRGKKHQFHANFVRKPDTLCRTVQIAGTHTGAVSLGAGLNEDRAKFAFNGRQADGA